MITEILKSINDNFNVKVNGCTGNCKSCTSIFCMKAPNANSLYDQEGRPKGIENIKHHDEENVRALRKSAIKR